MQIYHSFDEVQRPRASVCTVGTFDGVHVGHQRLIRAVVDDALTRGVPSAAVTFFPNPRVVLGRAPALYLTLPNEKARQLQLLGIDILVVIDFTRETSQITAAEFVHRMVENLRMISLWIGPNFALGKGRQGDAAYLRELAEHSGFAFHVMSSVMAGLDSVSSTRVRAALARGDLRDANLCLGRPFEVSGVPIAPGLVRVPDSHVLPAPGIYPALARGELRQATVLDDVSSHHIRLEPAPSSDSDPQPAIQIEFLGEGRV